MKEAELTKGKLRYEWFRVWIFSQSFIWKEDGKMAENQAGKRLAKGTVVYMIGNLSSKILQMLILPIITTSLVTSEYGYYDLIVTTISLVTPVVTLQMIEGMFRFMFNADVDDQKKTVSTVTTFLLGSIVALAGIIAVLNIAIPAVQYPILIFLNYVANIFFNYMQKIARCQQKNRQFAISGVINTIVMLGLQALTLLLFKMGVDGMLISNAVSYFVAALYLSCYLKLNQWFSRSSIDKEKFKELFKYSAPLIPNSLGWWVIASSDRYIVTWFLGSGANGIYSIAGKFSQLLTFVTTVFQLAWQESAIMEENSDERDRFYTKTFNIYMKLLLGGYLVVLPFVKIIIPVLLADSYQVGWLYVPILLIGSVFSAFSQFYGSAYIVFKRTGGAFFTTIVAAVINVSIGIGLIKWLGLFAPALGTALSFGVQWIIRAFQMRDYFRVKIDFRSLVILLLCGAAITVIYYLDSILLQYMCALFGFFVFLIVNREIIKLGFNKLKVIK